MDPYCLVFKDTQCVKIHSATDWRLALTSCGHRWVYRILRLTVVGYGRRDLCVFVGTTYVWLVPRRFPFFRNPMSNFVTDIVSMVWIIQPKHKEKSWKFNTQMWFVLINLKTSCFLQSASTFSSKGVNIINRLEPFLDGSIVKSACCQVDSLEVT